MGKNNLENILKTEGIKNEQPIKSRYYKIAEGLELFSYGSGYTGLVTLLLMPKLPVYAIYMVSSYDSLYFSHRSI